MKNPAAMSRKELIKYSECLRSMIHSLQEQIRKLEGKPL